MSALLLAALVGAVAGGLTAYAVLWWTVRSLARDAAADVRATEDRNRSLMLAGNEARNREYEARQAAERRTAGAGIN